MNRPIPRISSAKITNGQSRTNFRIIAVLNGSISAKASAWVITGFAVFWNLISSPVLFILPEEIIANQNYLLHVRSEVDELMRWNFETSKKQSFLNAIDGALKDPEISQNQKSHIAVFITEEGKWDFRFSGACSPFFSLANSFHIKPLIRYFHRNRRFFVLNFEKDQATLYVDGPERLRKLDGVVYPAPLKGLLCKYDGLSDLDQRRAIEQFDDFTLNVSDWISSDLVNEKAPLIVCGERSLAWSFRSLSKYRSTIRERVWSMPNENHQELFQTCKRFVGSLVDQEEDRAIEIFQKNLGKKTASAKLEVIARESVRDNVSVLMVSKEEHLWGEFNRVSGDVKLHSEQLSDLDDDLLDDIAEVCLSNGTNS